MAKRTHNVKLLDGTYELYFDNSALYEFEEKQKDTAINVISTGQMGFRAITNFVWAGLLHSDERLPLVKVKEIIPTRMDELQKVAQAIMAAVDAALDTGKSESAKNEKAGRQK
jgi:hypothetical protein